MLTRDDGDVPMKMTVLTIFIAGSMVAISSAAYSSEVSILKKKPWVHKNQTGYLITYKYEGKVGKNAKVYCSSGEHPMYLIEGLDRGDSVKVDISVAMKMALASPLTLLRDICLGPLMCGRKPVSD
jgi:hypothetical protein